MASLKPCLGWICDQTLRTPLRTLAALVPLLLLALYGITQIRFEDGIRSVFSSTRSEYTDFVAHGLNFSRDDNNITILLSSRSELSAADLSFIQEMAIDAQFLDEVEAVFSLFSLRRIEEESGDLEPLIPGDFDRNSPIRPYLLAARQSGISDTSIISEDLRETVIILSLNDKISNMSAAATILAEINNLASEYENAGNFKIKVTGLLPLRQYIVRGIQADQMILNVVGALLGFLAALLIFRNFWIALLNGVAPVIALVFSLGIFGYARALHQRPDQRIAGIDSRPGYI